MEKYYAQFENCRQKEEAECIHACPFHFDILDFQDKIKKHKYDRAYKAYRNAVLFPDIIARICPEYCIHACPRRNVDGSVQLKLLEETCVMRAKRKGPIKYNLPQKGKKIGIIGAGISGLACALKLLEAKYTVVIFEKTSRIGGQLRELLPEEIYLSEFELQFGNEEYELKTGFDVHDLKDLEPYDICCFYVATGQEGEDFGVLNVKDYAYMEEGTAVFGGGSLVGKNVTMAAADGIRIAQAIDVFLKTGKLDCSAQRKATRVVPDVKKLIKQPPVIPSDHGIFTEEEAEQEASRCIRCQCNVCWQQCDMVGFYEKWPTGIREEIITTVMSAESMIHKAPAIRLLNTCTQCGALEKACPEQIQLGDMILKARKLLHKQNKMPLAYHGFWLDDMEHANSDAARICRHAPGKDTSKYVFFPGCNLGAADPRYVEKPYQWLLEHFEHVGLLVRCCGIHGSWSGEEQRQQEAAESLYRDWETLGMPTFIAACPSCIRYIRKTLPEIKIESFYEFLERDHVWPKLAEGRELYEERLTIFDPCAAREDKGLKNAVRKIAEKAKLQIEELAESDAHRCCGFGGDTAIANPEFTKYVAKQRIALSSNPYLTYCMNCRDVFLDEKKPAIHLLDILFDINGFGAEMPTYTERRENRRATKKSLLEHCWKEKMTNQIEDYSFTIVVDEKMKKKMQSLRLVEEDIKEVIKKSNEMRRRIYDKARDEYICYAKLNYITCWVAYQLHDNSYHIKNVYTHRMEIELEAVWNGRKVNADL